MINREIIRIKIVQLTYAYYQNGNKNIDTAEKELFFSLSKAYDLYNYLLALIVAVTKEAGRRLEVAQARARREGQPEPSQKFVFNRFALQLEENKALADFLSTQKFTWDDVASTIGQLFETIESSEIYKEYMESKEDDYLKTIKRFKEQNGAKEELLPEWDSDEEKEYARKLFRAAILNDAQYQRFMSEASRNWDFSRLAYMDVIIMQIAIAEIMTFPNIPISVSINEYVEIAKLYSTRKSGGYINGMLDAIARNLIQTGRLLKHMEPKKEKAGGKHHQAKPQAEEQQEAPQKPKRQRIKKSE